MTKKKPTPTQSIDNSTRISDSTFTGVHWDSTAVSAIQTVADGLLENAKALGELATVFRSQNIQIECFLKIEPKKATKKHNASI